MNHNEIKERLMQAENVEDVTTIAKETGLALTAGQAEKLFNEIHTRKAAGKLDENELTAITGGSKEYAFCKNTVRAEYSNFTNDGKVTQMTLNYSAGNFGMCYIITLADGSFVVFDGGGYSADYGDENRLYKLLKSLNKRTDGKITVAAWILTHDHWDHFTNFFNCVKKYGSEFKIEACYLNMPSKNATYNTRNPNYYFNNNFSTLSYTVGGTQYVKLHTGMKFYVRNAEFEVLYTQEDVFPDRINYFNESTTVLRMKLDGNTFMWNGDAKNWASKGIVSRYGSYVKSDICQVAHHGYDGMTQALYQTVDPYLLFWPTSNSNWTSQITGKTYAVDKYLYEKLGAENIIVAEPTKSIMLPYHKGDPIIVEGN